MALLTQAHSPVTKTLTSQGWGQPERRPSLAWLVRAGFLEEVMLTLSHKQ